MSDRFSPRTFGIDAITRGFAMACSFATLSIVLAHGTSAQQAPVPQGQPPQGQPPQTQPAQGTAPPSLPGVTVVQPKAQPKAAAAKAAKRAPATKQAAPAVVQAPPAETTAPVEVEAPAPQIEGGPVRAGQAANALSQTPLATQTTGDGIRRNEIRNFTDLGNTTEPGVNYSKNTDGPNIRGMDGARVTTVVDGIPIPYLENDVRASTATIAAPTNANGGATAFDFFSIAALDVVRGSDSSRIGSGALAGAIVMRTLEPEDIITDGRSFGGLSKVTYDGRDNSIGGGLAIAGRSGSVSALLQGSYKRGDETSNQGNVTTYGATRTAPNPADTEQDNLLFKLRHTTSDGHRFGVTAERYNASNNVDLATNWNRTAALSGYNPFNYFGNEGLERRRVSLEYSYKSPVKGTVIDNAFATAYWQELLKDSGAFGTQRNGTNFVRDVAFDHDTLGFVGGIGGNFWTGHLKHKWQTGTDLSNFTLTQFTTVRPASANARAQADIPKVEGTQFGIYVDDRISLGDSRFALTPGVRFDWHEYTPTASSDYTANSGSGLVGLPPSHSDSHVTPKILATYQVHDKLELFAQWAMAYRAPTPSELYINFTNGAVGYAQLGNPNLKAETGQGIELGANFGDKQFGGRVATFYNQYKNFISATDLLPDPAFPTLPFGVARYVNIADVELTGVEIKLHKRFWNGFLVRGALAYTYGKDGDGNLLPTVAPIKGIAGIGYEASHWGVDLTGIFVGRYRDDFGDKTRVDTTLDAPSYAIADLTGWWEPAALNGLRIQAGVKNLFDATYYDALSVRTVNLTSTASQPVEYYSQPGRSLVISATQKF